MSCWYIFLRYKVVILSKNPVYCIWLCWHVEEVNYLGVDNDDQKTHEIIWYEPNEICLLSLSNKCSLEIQFLIIILHNINKNINLASKKVLSYYYYYKKIPANLICWLSCNFLPSYKSLHIHNSIWTRPSDTPLPILITYAASVRFLRFL